MREKIRSKTRMFTIVLHFLTLSSDLIAKEQLKECCIVSSEKRKKSKEQEALRIPFNMVYDDLSFSYKSVPSEGCV